MRPDGRQPDELREISFERDYTDMTPGSVLVTFGRTKVLCTASVEDDVPRWMRGRGTGALEWPLRVMLIIGGFVVVTPGGGIMPLSQMQVTLLGLAILTPAVLISLVLIRRQGLAPNRLRAS